MAAGNPRSESGVCACLTIGFKVYAIGLGSACRSDVKQSMSKALTLHTLGVDGKGTGTGAESSAHRRHPAQAGVSRAVPEPLAVTGQLLCPLQNVHLGFASSV